MKVTIHVLQRNIYQISLKNIKGVIRIFAIRGIFGQSAYSVCRNVSLHFRLVFRFNYCFVIATAVLLCETGVAMSIGPSSDTKVITDDFSEAH